MYVPRCKCVICSPFNGFQCVSCLCPGCSLAVIISDLESFSLSLSLSLFLSLSLKRSFPNNKNRLRQMETEVQSRSKLLAIFVLKETLCVCVHIHCSFIFYYHFSFFPFLVSPGPGLLVNPLPTARPHGCRDKKHTQRALGVFRFRDHPCHRTSGCRGRRLLLPAFHTTAASQAGTE